jgi:uncharacterized NAD(P)/FAD-binding protein YdhS
MVDTVLAGMQAARGQAVFHAISRHGLLPAAQRPFRQLGEEDGASLVAAASVSLLHLFRSTRALAENLERSNGDWREAITLVRDLAPALWQRLPPNERRRFLRHARCYWDIHRHRLPESISAALHEQRRNGQLLVHAGRILEMQPVDKKIQVRWRARGSSETTTLSVDRIVNCTGPDYDVQHTRERLLRSLQAQGLALRDPLGLGLVTDEIGALVDIAGRAASNIYYLGPMLRARFWETTAVTELRAHAARLARHLARGDDERAVPASRHISSVRRPSAPAYAGATIR